MTTTGENGESSAFFKQSDFVRQVRGAGAERRPVDGVRAARERGTGDARLPRRGGGGVRAHALLAQRAGALRHPAPQRHRAARARPRALRAEGLAPPPALDQQVLL